MKGKYAARAENRRSADLSAQLATARETLRTERDEASRRITDLESEVRRLRADHLAEASRLADKEVSRRLEEAAAERRQRGISDDTLVNFVIRNDRFIMNACRYLSMTKGIHPLEAIPVVTTWATDKDFYGVTDTTEFLTELGVPVDGWVAGVWARIQADAERRDTRRAIRDNRPEAISLDRAESEGHQDIHPNYKPAWFGEGPSVSRPKEDDWRNRPRVKATEVLRRGKGVRK